MEYWIVWMVLGVVLIILEMFTVTFFVSLFGVSCIVAGVVALITDSYIIQLVFFIVTNILLLIFVRPLFLRYFLKNKTPSNVNALIGKTFIVSTTINNHANTGYIKSDGDFWKAKSTDNSIIIEGESVIVEKLEGNTVYVTKQQVFRGTLKLNF